MRVGFYEMLVTGCVLGVFGTVGCKSPRTEIIVVVDTDLAVPAELDRIIFEVVSPEGRMETASADPASALPAFLGVVHTAGPLSPLEVRVVGRVGGADIVERRARLAFQADRTVVLQMNLLGSCAGAMSRCGPGETCAESGCRPVAVGDEELSPWGGSPPGLDAGTPADASPDVDGGTPEVCNGMDDDGDSMVDEGFDLETDRANCGACGNACMDPTPSCAMGMCAMGMCGGTSLDCDGDPANGCEADTSSDDAHCGACDSPCAAGQSCGSGTCACPPPLAPGSAGCTDTTRDPLNCGSAGAVCGGREACVMSSCACRPALTAAGGTCVDLQADPENCGVLGTVCPAAEKCRAGACSPSCGADDDCARGCVDVADDELNCGTCGNTCATNQLCQLGACVDFRLDFVCDRCPCVGCPFGSCRTYPGATDVICLVG
jgi:hypothetical protein